MGAHGFRGTVTVAAAFFAATAGITLTAWLAVACLPSFDCYRSGSCGETGTSPESGLDGAMPPGDAGDAGAEGEASSGGGHRWRRAIQIHAGDAGLPAGYSVRVTGIDALTDAGHAQAGFGNVYVVGPDGGQLDRIVDLPPMPTPGLWFAAQSGLAAGADDDASYALEYGDFDAAPPAADGSAVFVTYDDFAGGALPPAWESQGYVTVSSGTVTLGPDVDAAYIARDNNGTPAPDNRTGIGGIGIEIRATTPAGMPPAGSFWLGFQVPKYTGCAHQIWQLGSTFAPDYCDPTAVVGTPGTPLDAGLAGQTHLFQVLRTFTTTHFVIDDRDWYDLATTDRTGMYPIVKNEEYPGTATVNMVRTRYVLDDDPTVTLGPEQPLP